VKILLTARDGQVGWELAGTLADELRVVSHQIGAPTSAGALAHATAELLRRHGTIALGDSRGT